jgi:hypothetical protein
MINIITSLLLILCFASCAFAEDFVSTSGMLKLRGVIPLNSDSASEYPSLQGRVKIDTNNPTWLFHLWLEGGWDGSVDLPVKDHAILKNWDEVYQSTTPYLEFKELYAGYAGEKLELRIGVQRFSWGRLDEYPVNDLLNPWDYTQFLRKSLEERKIGVPSLSARFTSGDWSAEAVWVPLFVPYRLPLLTERWAGTSGISSLVDNFGAQVVTREPDLPPRTLENGSAGIRVHNTGPIEWGINLFHGYDPRPVFKTTNFAVVNAGGTMYVDSGVEPDFHKISSFGFDAATVWGDWSIRAEAAYTVGRYFNTSQELWGYPITLQPGIYPLNPNEHKSDSLDYGIGVDYRLFEDCFLTMQAQQKVILDRPETLYDRKFETLFWFNLKNGFLNQKIETNLNLAYNPEHGDTMAKANAWYVFTDSWKTGVTMVAFWGPSQSLFGRYSKNDQVEAEIVYSW